MNISDIHRVFLKCSSVSIDTRKIEDNSLFVAIKGDRFDANTFAKEALERGAAFVIIDNPSFQIDERTILVNNSLETLQQLAKFHRQYLKLPIVALTGSNGKTTTKELINVVLSKNFKTKATVGNLNNHIGVPLTLLSFNHETEIGIVEMGANHQKEIEFLCELAQPDFGYITNFGKAHLEGFGGTEGVIKGKSEMYHFLAAHRKTAFVNLDDSIQTERTKTIKSFTFGVNHPEADVNFESVTANPLVKVTYNGNKISSNLIGLYNANNINAAICIGKYFGLSDAEVQNGIESYMPENNRSQLVLKNSNEIILDAYNANPSSMAVATQNFIQLDNKKSKIAILGDMFELGSESLQEHKNLISSLESQIGIKFLFIGKDFFLNKTQNPNFTFFENFDQLSAFVKENPIENSLVLIKGSRGMALERVLEFL